jgi:exopolysaccharide production protein ExoZ
MNPAERSTALEGLRGYAAFLVFLVHAFGLLAGRLYGIDVEAHSIASDPDPVRAALVFFFRSHYGVDLFFVLSGLLMGDLALRRWRGARRFLWRRWLRIYPTYAASTLIVVLALLAWQGRHPTAAESVVNTFLLQGFFVLGVAPLNPTSWSLTYEAVFYLLVPFFALAAAGRTPTLARTAFPLAVVFALLVIVPAVIPAPKAIFFAYFALFVPGVALGLLDEAARARVAHLVPLWVVLAAWIAFTLGVKLQAFSNRDAIYYLASSLAGGLVVLKACDAGGFLGRTLSQSAPLWLGRHSYSFFLIHYIVVHAWGAALLHIVPIEYRLAYSAVFLVGALALSLGAARLLFAATERFYFRAG